jgi:hypothetical protein
MLCQSPRTPPAKQEMIDDYDIVAQTVESPQPPRARMHINIAYQLSFSQKVLSQGMQTMGCSNRSILIIRIFFIELQVL